MNTLTELHDPAPRPAIIAMGLAAVPADDRELLHAAFDRLAKDPGWRPEVRGLAVVARQAGSILDTWT